MPRPTEADLQRAVQLREMLTSIQTPQRAQYPVAGLMSAAADFTPVVGDLKALTYDLPQNINKGDYGWAAIDVLSAIPALGIPADAIKAAKSFKGNISKEDILYLSRKALDGDGAALSTLEKLEELGTENVLRRAKNRVAKADAERYSPSPDPIEQAISPESYRGQHLAPSPDYGAPLHDLTSMLPEDIYSPQGMRLYGLGDTKVDRETFSVLNKVRGNPDAMVTIYRSVPKGITTKINDGDWVSPSKEYVRKHGEAALDGDYDILEKKVKARTLYSAGEPYELGYNATAP